MPGDKEFDRFEERYGRPPNQKERIEIIYRRMQRKIRENPVPKFVPTIEYVSCLSRADSAKYVGVDLPSFNRDAREWLIDGRTAKQFPVVELNRWIAEINPDRLPPEEVMSFLRTPAPAPIPDPMLEPTAGGTVYFVKAGKKSLVKIGWTAGPVLKRIQELQTGSPFPLAAIATMPGSIADERALHKRFHRHRVSASTEWFVLSDTIRRFIKALLTPDQK